MSKKKTIILFSLLFLLILSVFGFFYFKSLKVKKVIPKGRSDAEIIKELESFKKGTKESLSPNSPLYENAKTEKEIIDDLIKL